MNVPIVIAGLVLGYRYVLGRGVGLPRLDPVGAGLSIVGLGSMLWAIIEAPAHGWTSPEIVAAFFAGVAIIGGFWRVWEAGLAIPCSISTSSATRDSPRPAVPSR